MILWTLHFHSHALESALFVVGVHLLLHFLPAGFHRETLSSGIYFHGHHWWWSYPCAFMATLDHPVSLIASAHFISCHLHGVAVFGFDPVFNAHQRGIFIGSNQITVDKIEGKEKLDEMKAQCE